MDVFERLARPRPSGRLLNSTFVRASRHPEGIVASRLRKLEALTQEQSVGYQSTGEVNDEVFRATVEAKVK